VGARSMNGMHCGRADQGSRSAGPAAGGRAAGSETESGCGLAEQDTIDGFSQLHRKASDEIRGKSNGCSKVPQNSGELIEDRMDWALKTAKRKDRVERYRSVNLAFP
jgi:hypothetical protein